MTRIIWAIYENGIYDLSDYFNTLTLMGGNGQYKFLDESVTQLWQQQGGQDITDNLNAVFAGMKSDEAAQHKQCLNNAFYRGITDFRTSARCVAPNSIPLAFSAIICLIILIKCA